VWVGIKAQLLAEGLIERKRAWNFWKNLLPSSARLRPALSGALVTLILVRSLYFFFGRRTRESIPPPALPKVAAFEDLKTAELKYEQAIEELSRVSQRKLAALNPDLAQIFNGNLATMDYDLNECKQRPPPVLHVTKAIWSAYRYFALAAMASCSLASAVKSSAIAL
jgi:hypothetical protein